MSSSTAKDDKPHKKNKKLKGKSRDEAAGIDTRLHYADSAHVSSIAFFFVQA